MSSDYKISSDLLDNINAYADEIFDILEDKVPFFMVFAIENYNYKTEYKTFYTHPTELGMILGKDKLQKIFELHNIKGVNAILENKDWSLTPSKKAKLQDIVNHLMLYCVENRIPAFVSFATSNKKNKTSYIMDITSPYHVMLDLYNDRITKVLRYTLDPDFYPGRYIDATINTMEVDSIEAAIAERAEIHALDEMEEQNNTMNSDEEKTDMDPAVDSTVNNTEDIKKPIKRKTKTTKNIKNINTANKEKIKTSNKKETKPKGPKTLAEIFPDDFPA